MKQRIFVLAARAGLGVAFVAALSASLWPRPEARARTATIQPAQPQAEPAQRADDFVDRIGVATHWGYPDTPYGFAYEQAKKLLGESGIRHVRDGFHAREADLFQTYGIKSTLIFGPGDKAPGEQIKVLEPHAAMVAMIEGPNEVDIFRKTPATTARRFRRARLIIKTICMPPSKPTRSCVTFQSSRPRRRAPIPTCVWRRFAASIIW